MKSETAQLPKQLVDEFLFTGVSWSLSGRQIFLAQIKSDFIMAWVEE